VDAKAEDFPSELLDTINSWHEGMGSPEYRLTSSAYAGRDVPLDLVDDCMRSLKRSLTMTKHKDHKKSYTKSERDALGSAIDMLEWIYRARAKGHEPI
jgi:hypothetical protein